MVRKTRYGRLEYILQCNTQTSDAGRTLPLRCHLFAVITGCKIVDGSDATRTLVTYTEMDARPHVIDLGAVGAVIGRFHVGGTRPRWAIVDRSGELAHAVFTDERDLREEEHVS